MTTVPQSRPGGRRRLNLAAIVAGFLVLAAAATFGIRALTTRTADPLAQATIVPVTRGDLTLGVSATGQVEPRVQAELAFGAAAGRVAEVLVAEGDAVRAGDALIALDSRELAAARAAAAANLAAAQADLQAVRDGATPEQLAEAQAQVAAAQGVLSQTRGSVTQADVAAARAAVDEARARLTQLEAGAKSADRQSAQAGVDQARANLQTQRDALAQTKLDAELRLEQAANALRNAQDEYSRIYWDNKDLEKLPGDLPQARIDQEAAAQRAVADGEAALEQARLAAEQARQAEATGIQAAEAQLRDAEARQEKLLAPADADALAGARAQVARAEADLARLTGGERSGAVAAQVANLEAAQARLGQLTADPASSDLARASARVAQAQAQLDQAQIQLDDATLRAPFDGVVATVNVAAGEAVGAQAPLVLIDITRFLVKVTVDEVDIARVQPGQDVQVLIDALGETLPGKVTRLEPLPQSDSAVTAYLVTVEIDPAGTALKPGMTASATIVADARQAVLTVPAGAVRSEDGKDVVGVVVTGQNGERAVEDTPVTVGLRTPERVEILSGLSEGAEVVIR